jgi:hypothetical protein
MPYVDLHRQEREQHRQNPRERTSLWRGIRTNPFVLIAAGFAFGVTVSSIFLVPASGGYEPLALVTAVVFLALVVLGVWHLTRDKPGEPASRLGGEKQLLMAIQRSGGGITPVEVALETSLTVDEADDILNRFAGKGHLRVEGRDSSLYYSLPERRGVDATG